MKDNKNKIIIASAVVFVLAIVVVLFTIRGKKVDNISQITDPETLKAMTYGELTEEDAKVENCDYVQFSAFFTRDLDGDGYAERIKGTCKEITTTDTLYAEINVLTKGSFKNGKITLNGENFTWTTAIVEDNIVAENHIGQTTSIDLRELTPGTQKLLWGTINSKVGNNINNYSKVDSITLTGTYVDDEGNETEISKTVDLTVDWYGETATAVNKYYYSTSGYTSYQNQMVDIATAITDTSVELSFKVAVSEKNRKLLLQKQVAEITIPELNGYSPLEVTVLDKNVEYNYTEETGILTITRQSTVNDEGNITTQVSTSNLNNVTIKYPLEAYDQISADSIVLSIPVVGYNYGYNNKNEEFQNPYVSKAEEILTVTYSKPSGNIWNIYATVGNYERVSSINAYRYEVSKGVPTDIYNGNIYEDEKTTYPVKWEVVIGDYTAINKLTLEEQKENENNISDKFLNTSNTYTNMYDYITTTGIYFTNASSALGSDGWIKLYNAETGSLIETFTSSTWGNYTKEKPYALDLKSIKIETSAPVANTTLNVYQIKELDDKLLTDTLTQEEFEKLSYIYTYLKGQIQAPDGITYNNGTDTSEINRSAYAYYDEPYSVAKITVTPNKITNQKTENVSLVIQTSSASTIEKKWMNGVFLIELPENIINANINSIETSDENIKISASEVVEENGKYYIKIYTSNEEETIYKITINAELTANPTEPTEVGQVKLYSYNENCDNYYSKTQDQYDIDADGKTNDFVCYATTTLTLIAPSGLLTTEYVTNYDDLGTATIAPNIAEIEKSDETRTATINVSVTNNYSGTISNIVILGKTPFEGNTYVLNEGSLNSQYTANMTGEITVPEKLQKYTTVYYSTKENPTNDINYEANEWKTAKEITDWSEIRTYLIDLSEYTLAKTENEVFTYEVQVPAGVGYNTVTYCDHAVYYNLDTENGKLTVQTEPNKVGIQVVSKYSMQLTKNKNTYDDMLVQGATYSITTTDVEGNEIAKTFTTDINGKLKFNGMYVEKEYTLKEISSPSDYVLNTNEIKFRAEINENEELVFNILEGEFKQKPEVTTDENGNYLVKTEVEDEAKYTLTINKTDENGEALKDVRFVLTGKDKPSKVYRTNENGILTVTGLYPNEEYKLQETKADGYYVDQETRTFKVVRNDEGNLEIQTEDKILKNANVVEEQKIAQAIVTLNIQNEKIPTYNLQILKVEENSDEENLENLKTLEGATFELVSEDLRTQKEYKTNENGYVEIPDLYEYVEGKYITGKYILKETKAPDGYSNNAEEINFKVAKNEDNNLEIIIENQENLTTIKSATVKGNTIKIVLQDKPIFKITKIDSETGKTLANAKFVIYELDENGIVVDFAKDVNGSYVGEKNQYDEYVVTTDEKGVISLPLRAGTYTIVEIGYPDGYQEDSNAQIFKVDGDKTEETTEETNEVIEINYIEDLVDLSNSVNAGNRYSGTTIKLMRTLDFEDDQSYRVPNSTSYGDLNGDGTIEGIKLELTDKEDGCGFTPIGMSNTKYFLGVFDGQENEIRNLYINTSGEYAGLFGYVMNGEIKNVGVTGEVSSNSDAGGIAGGIAGVVSSISSISNCYNTGEVNSNACAGGIAGDVLGSGISNCYNTGEVSSNRSMGNIKAGGIAGDVYNSSISNCYNTGKVIGGNGRGISSYVGGIAGYVSGSISSISNCYNTGEVSSSSGSSNISGAGGITGYVSGSISNCYNTGEVSSSNNSSGSSSNSYAGGIAGRVSGSISSISNCYNTGEVSGSCSGSMSNSGAGGIAGHVSGSISNCYNTGEVSSSNSIISNSVSKAGGIAGQVSSSSISNCYNTGEVNSSGSGTYAGGIVGNVFDSSSSINNCYYLETISITGNNINPQGTAVSKSFMMSKDFYTLLNVDEVWLYINNNYPILSNGIVITASTEIIIENTIKKFKITTDVQEIDGFKGGNISGEDEDPYETVIVYKSNEKEIIMTPDEGYGISNITINGEKIDYIVNTDGTYTIPIGYFDRIEEDKHIVVTYTPLDQILTINKVDENDSSKTLEGTKFRIEQISPSNTDDLYSGEFETNAYGQIREAVPANSEYKITEIQASDGYILNSEPITYTVKAGEDNTITITNKHQCQLIVHHYLKQADGTYTTLKVAEDEVQKGNVGEEYVTSPKVDLTDLWLEQDYNGKYVIPSNATGTYTEDVIEVIYYYETKPIELKINHYLEGTNDKLAVEKTGEFDSTISFNEDGTYEVTTQGSYAVNSNEEYKTLLKDYVLTRIESSVVAELDADDTLKFTENAEITYYYTLRNHVITTEVKAHEEQRTSPVTNEKEITEVDGGTITGKYTGAYKEEFGIQFVEAVDQKQDSTVEIVADPNTNYTVKQIKLVSTNDEGIQTESIIYGENAVQNAEITATEDEEGNVTLTTFKTVTENKHIIVEFAPIQGTVIVHHYIEGTGEEFGTKAIKVPSKEEGKVVEDETKQDYIGEKYATKQSENIAPIYELVSTSGETSGEYIDGVKHVYYYYNLKDYKYTIHYFYDGIEDTTKIENGEAEYGTVITEYPDKPDGYTFQKVEPVDNEDSIKTKLSITDDESKNVINVYYATPYQITTDIIEHTEEYKDGTVKENVKGGNISGELTEENNTPYEIVFKGKQPQNAIKITPTKTDDEEYEIVKVIVKNNKADETGITVNLDEIEKAEDGSIILPTKYLADPEKGMQSDKHIEVEFRKKTNVIIKQLEKGTEKVLYKTPEGKDYEEIIGYEGEEFETARKTIQNYMASEVGITDENNNLIENYSKITTDKGTYANGTMYADTLTIIYWYERIPAGIIVKHIEINEQDKKEGLTLQSGTVLDEELINGFVSLTEDTERKIYSEESGEVKNEKYKNYISVDGPQSTDENVVVVGKEENAKEVTYKKDSTIEVRYYYEKQHKLTTEVKPHTETINGAEKLVDGGTISKEYIIDNEGNKQETTYETINHRGYNKKQIEIIPDAGYRAKQITIQNVSETGEVIAENIYARADFEEDSNHKIILKSGEINEDDAYFKDVQKDIHVIVEFERIPAKVIVEYRDIDTGEIIPGTDTKPIEKFVGNNYETEQKDIKNYVFVEEEYPENSKGIMTEEDITVIYWYTKQCKITTDVIEHTEVDKNGNVSKQKGGSITAEDEDPYELVNRGNSNTLDIEIEPFSGYKIKEIQINGKVVDYINDKNIVKEENKVKIPKGYFNKIQEDKHITVEYERIPAVVKVQYLEEGTEKVLYTTSEGIEYEQIDGYVNETYETKEIEIENYELVQEKYPSNSTGTMTEEEIIVKYYYKKALFNMKVEKEIEKVAVTENGKETTKIVKKKSAKVAIKYKEIDNIAIEVSYKIKVTNTEKVEGTAILEEYTPEGFEFVADKSDAKWKRQNEKFVLETEEIKPGETKEYKVTLKWIPIEENKGAKVNTVRIANTHNEPECEETTKEDNEDIAIVEVNLEKEIGKITNDVEDDIKDEKTDKIIKDIVTNVKTGDVIIFFIGTFIIAGAVLVVIIRKRK